MPILPKNAGDDAPVPLGLPVRVVPLVLYFHFIKIEPKKVIRTPRTTRTIVRGTSRTGRTIVRLDIFEVKCLVLKIQ
jgi:hypothetical protein